MYFSGVNLLKAFLKQPVFAKYFFINSGSRVLYYIVTKKRLRKKNYAGLSVHELETVNEVMKERVKLNIPFMASRYGSTELNCITEIFLKRYGLKKKINNKLLLRSANQNGIFPATEETFARFADLILDYSAEIDILGTFRMIMEDYYIKYFVQKSVILTHRSLFDFWIFDEPYTAALKGKNVLVIHPFEKTILSQYKKRDKLFKNPLILPEFNLLTLKAVQTIAGQRDNRFNNWFDALNFMYTEAIKIDFDIAILGCGAYGLPLAAMLKKAGKTAIHMGGVTQMLFGIKGKRWDDDYQASKLYNKYWIRPDNCEVPSSANEVEGGCYW